MLSTMIKGLIKQKLRTQKSDDRPYAALIFGAGALPGIGAAVGQRVASEGMPVYLCGRNTSKLEASAESIRSAGGSVSVAVVDASRSDQVLAAFKQLDQDGYTPGLVVHNVGTLSPGNFLLIDPAKFEQSWRADCLSGFFIGQEAARRMQDNAINESGGRGTIIFTGASASLRGNAGFASFAANKAGLRSIAQAMAREFGPKRIHVVHAVVDGMVDGERMQTAMPQLLASKGEHGGLNPLNIGEAYWMVHRQHASAWTHELDLRPHAEAF